MSHDGTRRRGFCANIISRLPARSLVHLRAVDRALQILERGDETDASPLACAMREAVRDIEAEESADDEAHERARDEMVPPTCTGLTARWCPRCGDCTCGEYPAELNDPGCPLHAPSGPHAEAPALSGQALLEWRRGAEPVLGLGDDVSDLIAVPIDSDAPAGTYQRTLHVVADDGEAPDELGGGG